MLVEAPADAQEALAWIGEAGLVPPVALLGYVVTHPERAVFAPLASFSPEWQAVSWAHERGVELRAIDLPLAATLAEPRPQPLAGDDLPVDPLGELAAAAGEADAERWWDDLVEHRGDGEPVFEVVAEAMAAVRTGRVPSDHEARREAHMRQRGPAGPGGVRHGRRGVRCMARPGSRPSGVHGGRRRGAPATPTDGQGGGHLGALDAPAAAPRHRVRRRRRQPRLVRPRVPASRPGRCVAVLRGGRPHAAPAASQPHPTT